MRFVLISDNHGQIKPLNYIQQTYGLDYKILHCGDFMMEDARLVSFECVQGNNDYFSKLPKERIIHIDGVNILLTHGNLYSTYSREEDLARAAKDKGCQIVCYGHTHVPYERVIDGVLVINPGSLSHNRDGSLPSYMIVEFNSIDDYSAELRRL